MDSYLHKLTILDLEPKFFNEDVFRIIMSLFVVVSIVCPVCVVFSVVCVVSIVCFVFLLVVG